MRLGESLPDADALKLLSADSRVAGCTSVVDVLAGRSARGTLELGGTADSRLARGIVALLVRGFGGAPVEALVEASAEQVAEAAGLPGVLSASRLNGLANMLETMRAQLRLDAAGGASSSSSGEGDEGDAGDEVGGGGAGQRGVSAASLLASIPTWSAAPEEVAVLLSGGVDSSVALRLLQEQGYRCRAFYLRIWLEDEQMEAARGSCPWEEDWEYANAVCAQAGVPLEAVSLQEEYHSRVVSYLVDEAKAGRTPNPDIMCNSRIKFGAFHEQVGRHFQHVASGHYARVAPAAPPATARPPSPPSPSPLSPSPAPPRVELLRAADEHKDQTYFLSQLTQAQLASALFPVGELTKPEVRAEAARLRLPNRARKDSQGICFLGKVDYSQFIAQHLGEAPGPILEHESGARIGTHRGLWFHTVGQRRGLGPALTNEYCAFGPWHVTRKDIGANALYASRHYTDADKPRNAFVADSLSWVAGAPPAARSLALRVKTRHGAHTHEAEVTLDADGERAHVQLHGRDKGLAPGQYAAWYDGDVCLGSGVISEEGL